MFSFFACIGCSPEGMTVKISSYSDSSIGIEHKIEYDKWASSSVKEFSGDENITLEIGGKTIIGKHNNSKIVRLNNFQTEKYKTENGDSFEVDHNNKLTAYYWSINKTDNEASVTLTQEACLKIANDFLNNIVDVNDYIITVNYDEDSKIYDIHYRKYSGDIELADYARISVRDCGALFSFYSSMLGRIENNAEHGFDMNEVEKAVIEKLDKIYLEAREKYDEISYRDLEYVLTLDESNNYIIVCTLNIDFINIVGEYKTVVSEKIQMVVEK